MLGNNMFNVKYIFEKNKIKKTIICIPAKISLIKYSNKM